MRRSVLICALVLPGASARAEEDPPPLEVTDEETIIVDDTASPVDTPSAGVRVVGQRALELHAGQERR